MSEFNQIKNTEISDDNYLLNILRDKDHKISFIQLPTREFIKNNLNDNPINLQTRQMIKIWEKLIGDAIIFLKSKDKREIYHDKMALGTKTLCEFLEEFQDFEPILYGAVPNYRDHIAHVIRVFLLGQHLIKGAIGFENMKIPDEDDILKISGPEKEAIWCIASLTHDLGYALERFHAINKKARKMLEQFGNIPVQELGSGYFSQFGIMSDFVIKFLSAKVKQTENKEEFCTHVQAKYYQKFLCALTDFNHGVISSVILMKSLVFFKEADFMIDSFKPLKFRDARQFIIRREILRTIASHSCDDIYYLSIKNFSFMLKLCDEMQEWGRPRLLDLTKRGGSNTFLHITEFSSNSVDYKVIFLGPNDHKPTKVDQENTRNEIEKYFVEKTRSWLKVLRSGVSPFKKRKIKVKFTFEDKTKPEKIKIYELKHTNPSKIIILPEELRKREFPQINNYLEIKKKPDDFGSYG